MTVMVHLSITEYNWYSEILFGTSQFVMIVEETVELSYDSCEITALISRFYWIYFWNIWLNFEKAIPIECGENSQYEIATGWRRFARSDWELVCEFDWGLTFYTDDEYHHRKRGRVLQHRFKDMNMAKPGQGSSTRPSLQT